MPGSSQSAILLLVALAALICHSSSSFAETRTLEGFVQKVSDGDTVTLVTRDGAKLRVRLYGIDAPEVRHEKKPGQSFGEEAKRKLTGKVLRKEVRINIQDRDQYKHVVGFIMQVKVIRKILNHAGRRFDTLVLPSHAPPRFPSSHPTHFQTTVRSRRAEDQRIQYQARRRHAERACGFGVDADPESNIVVARRRGKKFSGASHY